MTSAARFIVVLVLLGLAGSVSAWDGMPENYIKRWEDPVVQQRIDAGIEKHRKGDAVMRILDAKGRPVADADVELTQTSHEFLFGCNIFVLGQMKDNNRAYEDAFLKLFNFATVAMYWSDLEPDRGNPRFAEGSSYKWRRPPPDRIVAFGKKHGLTLKGHPLLWHAYNPEWMPKDADELKTLYKKRFKELALRYADDVLIWDGVNESLICVREFPLFSSEQKDYPLYVPWAFAELHKVFNDENLLMINEVPLFNWPSDKTNRYYKQCVKLLKNGVGIEGIGFQLHICSRKNMDDFISADRCDPGSLLDTYEMFADLGLPVWMTELTLGSSGNDGLKIQARVVRDLYRLWFSVSKMSGITWWNLADGTAAYDDENSALGGLLDKDCKPKPSYEVLNQLINGDWKTELKVKSDSKGIIKFRGFYGKYSVKVHAGDVVEEHEIDLFKDGRSNFQLTVQTVNIGDKGHKP